MVNSRAEIQVAAFDVRKDDNIRAGFDRADGRLLGRKGVADRTHLQIVAHDHAVEANAVTSAQRIDRLGGQRCRQPLQIAEARVIEMADHDRIEQTLKRKTAIGLELEVLPRVRDVCELAVAIDRARTVTGKVLRHRCDIRRVMGIDKRGRDGRDRIGIAAETPPPRADDGIVRIRIDIHDGPQVHVEAELRKFRRHFGIDRLGNFLGVEAGILADQSRGREPAEALPGSEPLHSTSLLVHGDEGRQVGPHLAQRRDQRLQLRLAADIVREQHDAADGPLLQLRADRFDAWVALAPAGKPDHDGLADLGVKIIRHTAGGHNRFRRGIAMLFAARRRDENQRGQQARRHATKKDPKP